MSLNRNFITGPCCGNEGSGTRFDDKPTAGNINTAKITRISVWYSSYVHALHVVYSNQLGTQRGKIQGTQVDISLAGDEYITHIAGNADNGAMSKLTFTTNNHRTFGPYGNQGSSQFTSSAQSLVSAAMLPNMGLLYFTGSYDNSYIYSLRPTFVQYRGGHVPLNVKYERHESDDANTQSPALSKFSQNLMSTIATLVVGPSTLEFRAYENILCRLPFFAAALQGRFREASEKRITMPEDEPAIISALIEFLYTGHYTYTYTSSTSTDPPPSDLAEGAFHIGVYAAALKYDCQELRKLSVGALTKVIKELVGVELVRLWKMAYANGLSLGDVKDVVDVKGEIVPMLREAYKSHKDEMEKTVEEFPALGSDFLRALVEEGI